VYNVSLTVTDDQGATNTAARTVTALSSDNVAPVADFSASTSYMVATFTDASTDSDGTIASRSWSFGDGTTSTATNPVKTYTTPGTYDVTLTVTDNGLKTHALTKSVTVSEAPPVALSKGVAVTGQGTGTGTTLYYTLNVPAGASNLAFTTSGGSGDADLYVKYGSKPTTSVFDCRSWNDGNAESCTFPTPPAGTYHVVLVAYSTFSGLSLVADFSQSRVVYTNGTDFAIGDNTTSLSPIVVSDRTGNAHKDTVVQVKVNHTFIGDLKVDLVAPDGSVYVLHNRSGGSADNINRTYTVNLSNEAINGTWKLRVNDNSVGDTGVLDSWSITL
jgi:serine protease